MKKILFFSLFLSTIIGCVHNEKQNIVANEDTTKLELQNANDELNTKQNVQSGKLLVMPDSFDLFINKGIDLFGSFFENLKIDSTQKNIKVNGLKVNRFFVGKSYYEKNEKWGNVYYSISDSKVPIFEDKIQFGCSKKNFFQTIYKSSAKEFEKYDTLFYQGNNSWVYYQIIFKNEKLTKLEYVNYPD
jgi:hypothetical protein